MRFSAYLCLFLIRGFPSPPSPLSSDDTGQLKMTDGSTKRFHVYIFMFLLSLPDTKVYAALGNHDFHPKNQLPAGSNNIYNQVAEIWRPWLSNESIALFKEGTNTICYYMHLLPAKV